MTLLSGNRGAARVQPHDFDLLLATALQGYIKATVPVPVSREMAMLIDEAPGGRSR